MCARPANLALKADIVKAATRIVENRGPDCVTMREVAQEVGYSATTLYLYFKDKDDILREVVLESFDDLAAFCAAAAVGPTFVDNYRQRSRAYVVWGVTHPSLYQLVFETTLGVDWTTEDGVRMARGLTDGITVLEQAVAAGELPNTFDVWRRAMLAWAGLHGVTSLAISRRLRTGAMVMGPDEMIGLATSMGDEVVHDLLAAYLT